MFKTLQNKPFDPDLGSFYVSIEGGECVGKTFIMGHLKERLKNHPANPLFIREPGYTPGGLILRQKVLSSELPLEDQIEIMLSDRIITQNMVVKPALMKGQSVLSDRCCISSFIYQGLMHNNLQPVLSRHLEMPDLIFPQLVIVATCDLAVASKRVGLRKAANQTGTVVLDKDGQESKTEEFNWLDAKDLEWHTNVHKHYESVAQWYPFPAVCIDFNRSPEFVIEDILDAIERHTGIMV